MGGCFIENVEWGKFIINGVEHSKNYGKRKGKGKDLKIIGNCVESWREREGHLLTKDMVKDIAKKEIDVLVIGTGFDGTVVVPERVERYLKEQGISEIVIKKTPEACTYYNNLYKQQRNAGMLVHGTC